MKLTAQQILNYCSLFGRWQIRTIGNQEVLYTTNLGSYLRFQVLEPNTITINALNNGNPIANPQIYAWRVDQQPWQRVPVTEMPIQIKVNHAANIEIMTAGNNDIDQVWTGGQGFAITGMDVTGNIAKPKERPRIVAIGDSITAGCWVAGKNSSFDYRPESNYIQLTADQCDFDVDRIAYSASGIIAPGTGGVPASNEWIDHLDQDTCWSPRPCQLVLVNLGTNDHDPNPNVFTDHFIRLLQSIKRQWQVPILVMTPFSQRNAALIKQATKQMGCQLIDTQNWCHHFTDHTHPNQAGSKEIADHLIHIMKGVSNHGKPTHHPRPSRL